MTTTTFSNLGYHLLWWRQPHIIFAEVLSSSWLFLVFSLHPSWPSSFSFHLPRYQQPPHEPDTTVCAHNISLCSHQSFQIPTFHFFFFLFILSPHSTYVSFLFLVSFFDIVTHLHLCMEYFPWIHGPPSSGTTSNTHESGGLLCFFFFYINLVAFCFKRVASTYFKMRCSDLWRVVEPLVR